MAGPPKTTPPPPTLYGYHKKPDFLASALETESKVLLKKLAGAFGDLFGASESLTADVNAAKKGLEEFAATQIPIGLGDHYMPVGMYLYGGTLKQHVTPSPSSAMKSQQVGTLFFGDGESTVTVTIDAIDPEHYDLFWQADPISVQLALTNATTVTATRSTAIGTALVAYEVREYYPTFLYGNYQTMMSSSSPFDGNVKPPKRATCSTCGAVRDSYIDGTLCSACKAKLDQVMDSSRELSPDEVGRALSEFVRKKLAKVEPVDDVRARGIKLEDDDPKKS